MIYNNILEAIGNTPLIKLNHIVPEGAADIFVKNEGLDVGGSIKTRTALNMIERAEKEGKLNNGRRAGAERDCREGTGRGRTPEEA